MSVLSRIVVLGILLTLAGCTANTASDKVRPGTFWPPLPDLPRYQYEGSLRSAASISVPDKMADLRSLAIGLRPADRGRLAKPFDVAAREGRIIVSDTVLRRIYLFDVPNRILLSFGDQGKGALIKPLGVAIDHHLNFYVADVSERCVHVYDKNGHFKRRIGSPKDLIRPTGVAATADGSRIYVVDDGGIDTNSHKVVVYNAKGKKLFSFGRRGRGKGEFNLPTQAAVAPDGTLYILDTGNFRVQAFDPQGHFLRTWGKAGAGFGQFSRPRGLAVDSKGRVYVSDVRFGNVQIFDPQGRLLMSIGQTGLVDEPGRYGLAAGVAVDETGRIYIVDQRFRKIEIIRPLSKAEGLAIVKKYKD